jgi:hypothetical protein
VLVIERETLGGGTSALSGGLIYLGGGTPVQKQCGFEDSPEQMFAYLMAACGPGVDEAKILIFCERSVEHFHWLVARGVPFKASFYPEGGTEPPTDDGLIFSGSEAAHPFAAIARPAPRGHHPQKPGAAGGFLMQKLLAAAGERRAPADGRALRRWCVATAAWWERWRARSRARARCAGAVVPPPALIQDDAMLGATPWLLRCKVRIGCEATTARDPLGMAAGAEGSARRGLHLAPTTRPSGSRGCS